MSAAGGTTRHARAARERADKLVVAQGLAASRERARALILAGKVEADGRRVEKAGDLLPEASTLSLTDDPIPFVSRGGVKLAGALDALGVDPSGKTCLDVGSSTGGFTDCLLQRGASRVTCVDVGEGLLDWTLRNDPRVRVVEGVNARRLLPEHVGEPPDLVTADVSFISLCKVLPAVVEAAPGAELVVLVKPQFEVGKGRVGKGGVVRDEGAWRDAVRQVATCLEGLGLHVVGAVVSELPGPAGNREFFLHASPSGLPADVEALTSAAIERAMAGGRTDDGDAGTGRSRR